MTFFRIVAWLLAGPLALIVVIGVPAWLSGNVSPTLGAAVFVSYIPIGAAALVGTAVLHSARSARTRVHAQPHTEPTEDWQHY